MIDQGIPSKIISILADQFAKVEYCVLTEEGRSDFFKSSLGLKQGDTISPRLFNFFFIDILAIFYMECDPPYLQGCAIHALLFADDLVLFIVLSIVHLSQGYSRLSCYSNAIAKNGA